MPRERERVVSSRDVGAAYLAAYMLQYVLYDSKI
jgi:hypothetical protein